MRRSKAEKQLDDAIHEAFKVVGNRRQFNIMDLEKISNETRAAVMDGTTVIAAMTDACNKYEHKGA